MGNRKRPATVLKTFLQQFFSYDSMQENVGKQQYNSSHSLSRANVWQQWLQRLAAFRFQKLIYKRETVRAIAYPLLEELSELLNCQFPTSKCMGPYSENC